MTLGQTDRLRPAYAGYYALSVHYVLSRIKKSGVVILASTSYALRLCLTDESFFRRHADCRLTREIRNAVLSFLPSFEVSNFFSKFSPAVERSCPREYATFSLLP